MIRLGLTGYFTNDLSALRARFPDPAMPPPHPLSRRLPKRPTSTNSYVLLRQSQDAIGWDHFLRGKFSSEWSRLQFKFAVRHNKVEESKNWLNWLIKYMSMQSHNLWCSRNSKRHGSDRASTRSSKLAQARRDVSALYELRDKVLPNDRVLFCASLEIHLLQPLTQLQNWLIINKELIRLSVRTAAAQAKAKTKPLRSFFPSLGRKQLTKKRHPSRPTARSRLIPSRVTAFFSLRPPRARVRTTTGSPTPPSSSAPRPRQRYLFDFFPNHPG